MDRARPAVGQQQRQRVRAAPAHVDEVDVVVVDRHAELRQLVQAPLLRAPVEAVAPVLGQLRGRRRSARRRSSRRARSAPASGSRRGAAGGRRASPPGRRCGTARRRGWRSLGLRSYHWRDERTADPRDRRRRRHRRRDGRRAGAARRARVLRRPRRGAARLRRPQRTGGTAVVLDVSDLDAAERAVRGRGADAATASSTPPASARGRRSPQVDEAEWGRVVDVNLSAPFLLTQRLLDVLADGGAIVNVTSAAAANVLATTGAFTPSYSAAKAGFASVTASLAGGARPARHPRERGGAGLHRDRYDRALRRRHAAARSRTGRRSAGGARRRRWRRRSRSSLCDAASFVTGATLAGRRRRHAGPAPLSRTADGTIRATPARRWCDPRGSVSETFWAQTPNGPFWGLNPRTWKAHGNALK